ncbi:helix-turn-helix domain-containing protein [Lelliottia sp. V89_10]|uniref:winged helix-turn-helix transcriptional regulator n=1 Tax=Lelliottia wanjuensis TaxID=3050585 RepID=UPI00249DF046|nr:MULTISPECIES: helix-turn-helix domain-containing protein [unclassified Lelliottia]MDI3362809.1 helix-turn-helix domain-containing protein [Lelliottia sp. V89_13]MDK9547634.1 helix-turn-helix domain-containing protein [Lelliottia sp. V89_5]MDK9598070.1 helix-turn-helix domain-containing protein [Lelliottia sp. V89_10]
MTYEETFVTTTCPVARTVDLLGDRWMLMIIRDAFDGISRFSDFQKSLGVAKNVLASRLKILVDAGVFSLIPAKEGGAYKAYQLTDKGKSLLPLIVSLRQWGEENLFDDGEAISHLVDEKGLPVAKLVVTSQNGTVLKSERLQRIGGISPVRDKS